MCSDTATPEMSDSVRGFVSQTPVSTWVADKAGTLIFENDANRDCFGIRQDADVVGKYNSSQWRMGATT
jgi:PAS domain-containing protein